MKNLLVSFFLLSACMPSDKTGDEILFVETSIDTVQKICGTPENLILTSFTPETRGKIDRRYSFFSYKGAEGRKFIFIDGFEDGCLRYVLSESASVYTFDGLASLLIDIPFFTGFPTLQDWHSRKREAGENLDEYLILSSRISNYDPQVWYMLIFGPRGLEAGAARLGEQKPIVITER